MKFFTAILCLVLLGTLSMMAVNTATTQDACVAPCEFRFAIYGDSRSGHAVHEDIVTRVASTDPSFILQTGDLVETVTSKSQWAKFDAITETLRKQNIVIYPAVGNHDLFLKKWVTEYYEARVPPPTRPGSTRLYYAFDKGNLRFISINSLRRKKLKEGTEQYKWLESELSDARANGKFVIPYFHIALFSVGKHGSDMELQKPLHRLFAKYNVRLVFQGHDHNYYRTLRCFAEGTAKTACPQGTQEGITYIVSGGGGAGLYNNEHKEQGVVGDKFQMANNYIIADVFPTEIVLTTYSSPEPATVAFQKLETIRCPIDSSSPCQASF